MAEINAMECVMSSTATEQQQRKVGVGLFLGVFFLPFIFAWFLLRKGHSTLARVLGFSWLVIPFALAGMAPPSDTQVASSDGVKTSPAQAATQEPKRVEEYSASQVLAAYEDNTVAADMLFKGKRAKVTGVVSDINTDFMGDPYVLMRTHDQFTSPHFGFDKKDLDVIAKLKKGAKVSVICKGKGDVAKTPMFDECQFAQ